MVSQSEGPSATDAGAGATTSVPTSSHTIYITFKPKVPEPGRPFGRENLSHEYRSMGVCFGLGRDTAEHRLYTMHALFDAVMSNFDRQYHPNGRALEWDPEGREQSLEEVFKSCKPHWQEQYRRQWETSDSYTDKQRPDGLRMMSETELVILTEDEFDTRFPLTPGECLVAMDDYPTSQPGDVVMRFGDWRGASE